MSSYQRIQDKRKRLQEHYDLLVEKLALLRKELAIQDDPSTCFKLKKQVEQGEAECDKIVVQLDELDAHRSSDRLHKSLLKLDYQEQVHAFRVFVESGFPVGAFLIHGAPHHGQTWLLTRLVRQYFQQCQHYSAAEKVRIDLSRHGRRKGIDSLWRELSRKVGLQPTATPQDIGTRVVEWCKDRHVILVFDEVNEIEPYFEEFITNFWCCLVDVAQYSISDTSDYRLIMFLVDSLGALSTHHSIYDYHFEAQWEPHIPVRLPSIVQLSADALLSWIEHEVDRLPLHLISQREQAVREILQNSESGIPELVLEEICDRCGCDWYEREHIWLKI